MKSLEVLQAENDLMDYIINLNKNKKLDYDAFENKKFFIKNEMDVNYD
jgi:hypothetical protein